MSTLRSIITNELLINGYIKAQKISIPADIIKLLLLFYHQISKPLTFCNKYNKGFALEENGHCAVRKGYRMEYIYADIESVDSGTYCWRVQTDAKGHWIMWGISEKKQHNSGWESHRQAYGIGKKENQWFTSNLFTSNTKIVNHNSCKWDRFPTFQCGEIDMLLDADNGQLNICIVGFVQDEAKLMDLPIPNKVKPNYFNENHIGWTPHFICNAPDQQLRIMEIPIECYGKPINDLFDGTQYKFAEDVPLFSAVAELELLMI
eukprot:293408_1